MTTHGSDLRESPMEAVQTDSLSAKWPMDSQHGFTFPQQIIIPPSRGNIGLDGRPQTQTYQINSEIKISYDQQGRSVSLESTPVQRLSSHLQPLVQQPQLRRHQAQVTFKFHLSQFLSPYRTKNNLKVHTIFS